MSPATSWAELSGTQTAWSRVLQTSSSGTESTNVIFWGMLIPAVNFVQAGDPAVSYTEMSISQTPYTELVGVLTTYSELTL